LGLKEEEEKKSAPVDPRSPVTATIFLFLFLLSFSVLCLAYVVNVVFFFFFFFFFFFSFIFPLSTFVGRPLRLLAFFLLLLFAG
jgi:hypothetical protein